MAKSRQRKKQTEIKIQLVVCCKDCKYAHLDYSGECNKYCDRFPELEDPYFPTISAFSAFVGDFYCGFAEAKDD